MEFVAYALVGCLSGTLAGLLGLGGGLLTVPAMVWLLPRDIVPVESIMHTAVASALVLMIPNSLLSAYSHHQKQAVLWQNFYYLAPGLFLGGILGAYLADGFSRALLQWIFAVFAVLVAITMLYGQLKLVPNPIRKPVEQTFVSFFIGVWSAMAGTGGGTLTVPYLTWRGIVIHKAVGTSAACGFPIAVAGAIGFILGGSGSAGIEKWALGYVYFPAVLGIGVTSLMFTPLGAKLAHRLPVSALKKILGVVLILIAARMMFV